MNTKNRTVIIIGGASGIGRGICEVMANKGASIAIADINENNAKEIEEELVKDGYEAKAYQLDVTDNNHLDKIVNKIITDFGQIDVLVNSAGRYIGAPGFNKIERLREEDWDIIFELNMMGTILAIETVIPHMKKQGFGKVITVSSVNAVFGVEKETAYSVSKAGVLQLTRSLAKELRKNGINVNCIMPGPVKTGRFMSTLKGRNPHDLEKINSTLKLDRVANPDDISPVVEFLLSDASDFISGELIRVDGGLFPQPM